MSKRAEIFLDYQNLIDGPPKRPQDLYGQACTNDVATVSAWRDRWISNIRANHKKFGSFKEFGIGKLWGKHQYLPGIVVGSGPSLKGNILGLKEAKGIPVVSCLHNFHFMEDSGIKVDYYVSLDAGDVVLEEVSEGGARTADEYWALTKDRTLVAYIGSSPELFAKWRGPVFLFNCPVPDDVVTAAVDELEHFHTHLSTGGNVLGAATYFAKGILGCGTIAFMGADFSFSYLNKFHGWDSKYDKDLGFCVPLYDVYGVKVKSWQSYANFKAWFDWVCSSVPGNWINCTEGGCLGSYAEGNMAQVRPMDLKDFLAMLQMNEHTRVQCEDPATTERKILF